MRSLVAALLILATPLCAQAEGRWRESRGAPAFAYAAPGRGPGPGAMRRPYGPPPQRQGGPPPGYGGPPPQGGYGGRPPQGGYAGPPRNPQERARAGVLAHQRVPLPVVIERLRRQTGAEYVDTREVRDPLGRPLYVLRFRQRGRYIDVAVDAVTGEVQR
jgi:hypothetical protein